MKKTFEGLSVDLIQPCKDLINSKGGKLINMETTNIKRRNGID